MWVKTRSGDSGYGRVENCETRSLATPATRGRRTAKPEVWRLRLRQGGEPRNPKSGDSGYERAENCETRSLATPATRGRRTAKPEVWRLRLREAGELTTFCRFSCAGFPIS